MKIWELKEDWQPFKLHLRKLATLNVKVIKSVFSFDSKLYKAIPKCQTLSKFMLLSHHTCFV